MARAAAVSWRPRCQISSLKQGSGMSPCSRLGTGRPLSRSGCGHLLCHLHPGIVQAACGGDRHDQFRAESGGDSLQHEDRGNGSAGLEPGERGLSHPSPVRDLGLGETQREAAFAKRLADQKRAASLVVSLAVVRAAAPLARDLVVGAVPRSSQLPLAFVDVVREVVVVSSRVLSLRVLWNTMRKTARRAGASQ